MKLPQLLTKNKMFNKMKKFSLFACAAMLASAVALTGCSSEVEGDYNGEVVKTEFAIAFPNQLSKDVRRMPSTTAQVSGKSEFQGMTGITLVPFAKQSAIDGSDARLGANISLVEDVAKADIDKPSSAKVYDDV